MAKVTLQPGADLLQVTKVLNDMGITVGQKLPDGKFVAYINRRKWLGMLYPDLIPLFQEDRRFWKTVRQRTKAGEVVSQSELEAHAKDYNQQFNEIIERYERDK